MLKSVKRELVMTEALLKTADVGEVEVIRLQKQVYELQGNITNRTNKYFQDSQAEMTKAEEDLATQEQLLAERNEIFLRTEVYAPTDGVVRNIKITTPGANVKSGDVVMEMLPTDSRLIIEAKLKPSDLAFIKKGSHASVKLDAYDYAIYGVLHGKVTYVSPDALSEAKRDGSDAMYYRVHVMVDDTESLKTKGGKKIEIQPGMTAQVEIRTGSMSALDYFLKPVTKTISGAFSER
jgi:HlyD family type I secretion membrane fusion protein